MNRHFTNTFSILLITLAPCTLFAQKAPAVEFRWAKNLGGAGIDQGRSIATDAEGNLYITGNFSGTVDLPLLSGTATISGAGSEDIYIAKANKDGDLIWFVGMGSSAQDRGTSVALDNQGSLYVCGYFSQTVNFNPGGQPIQRTSGGYSDGFLLKLDTAGNTQWVRQLRGDWNDMALEVIADRQGNPVTVAGFLEKIEVEGTAGNTVIQAGASVQNAVTVKYNTQGDPIWIKPFGGYAFGGVSAYTLTTDLTNNLYVAGSFSGQCDFNRGGMPYLETGPGMYVAKLDPAGEVIRVTVTELNNIEDASFSSIHFDSVFHRLYLSGQFEGRVDFDPGPGRVWLQDLGYTGDAFLVQLDTAGSFQWVRQFESFYGSNAHDVTTDRLGRNYICGNFLIRADLDPGTDSAIVESNGDNDAFITSLDKDGNFLWGRSFGGSGNEYAYEINVTDDFMINTTGLYAGNGDFHIDRDSHAVLRSNGNHDVFLHQIALFSCKPHDVRINADHHILSITEDFESYIWLFNGDTIPGTNSKSIEAVGNGYYQVAFTDANGCRDTSAVYYVNNLSIGNTDRETTLYVYPNPAGDHIYINGASGSALLTLKDINGRTVSAGNGKAIQVSHLAAGLYLLHIEEPGRKPSLIKVLKR